MAIQHINFDENTKHGRQLRDALRSLENGLEGLNDVFTAMGMMREGSADDPPNPSIGATLVSRFGFGDVATAEAAYNELNSLQAKLNANGQVADVNNALLQAFNKFR